MWKENDYGRGCGLNRRPMDSHLDPQLQWAGKTEHTSFEVPTVSLHVHERIDPRTIIETVRKKNGIQFQASLFEFTEENPPLREAVEFYKHKHNWSNRLIAGDSLLVMNSLLEKEGMAGKVQMIYIDPPYGIKYGSNFQPFVNKRDVKDGKNEDLTQEPEMIKAFRDTWELGIHSYLTYLRDRLLLARELLTESGSVFVQISDENVHHVREMMDEIYGVKNFCGQISFIKTAALIGNLLSSNYDYLLWYAKDKIKVKYRQLFLPKVERTELGTFSWIELPSGECRKLTISEMRGEVDLPKGQRFRAADISGQGETSSGAFPFEFEGRTYYPSKGRHWTTSKEGMEILKNKGRIISQGNSLAYKRFENDFPVMPIVNVWGDTIIGTFTKKIFVVQTGTLTIERCLLMTTDPGDLVLDPTCGSGTTAFTAEQWGRRWITCDTSRVAVALAKQRLMTPVFNYYELSHPNEGVGSGFNYKTVPHITLKSIANNEPPATETLYDQPYVDKQKVRVTGPFTVEAVPSPSVKSLDGIKQDIPVDTGIAREGETLRQSDWKDELLRTGIRGKGGQKIEFSRVETLPGTRYLHAKAETKDGRKLVVISFGPEHAPLERRQVELALDEAEKMRPKADMIVFAAFQFDPEAAKDIDETKWHGVTMLKAQMNADLLTHDLKKGPPSNESFWLMGQPDVHIDKKAGKYAVKVMGFDYYNVKTGNIESGGPEKIAMWMLDTDYDGRSLYPRQVFFPMSGEKEGWTKLAKNLKAEIDQELIETYRGTVSIPFESGPNKRIAVKIIDDRGIESLKVIEVD
ncbi:MAG: site-specific DNA-methyltransferase [Thermoplasmata archaeon]|nr:site-specific DNA-methyltransferase [Thermoplasmata archaeon]